MQHHAIPLPPDPAVLAGLPATMIADTIERLLVELDARDGDLDVEPNGDELDGNGSEDDFMEHGCKWLDTAGCPVSDPGEDDDDDGCTAGDDNLADWGGWAVRIPDDRPGDPEDAEPAWPEWLSLRAQERRSATATASLPHEDAEDDDRDSCLASDDDPARRFDDGLPGDAADTEPNGDEGDYSGYVGE